MVQRKEPEIRRSQQAKLERQSSSQHHQDDLKKKMMKLQRSIRAADLESLRDSAPTKPKKRSPAARGSPNYMKPTSSSDAKKEQLQVTTDKKRIPKNSKNSSPLPISLSRQSSLKAIRPLIKKSLIKGVVVNRATCSSTLKDMRFPEALDLDPGGTEAEGTSVLRVCPYTYCSLNGHRHEPLPLLKCFVSARRKLLKAQKSIKLKGLNLLRAKVMEKDKVKVPTGLEIDPPTEEEPEDFFVEIYATGSPEEQVVNEIVGDGEDQSSEFSMNFVEYVECDQQAEEAEEEKRPSVVPVENEGSSIPDNIVECSECPDGCPGPMPPLSESSINDEAEANTEQQQEVNQEDAEDRDTISSYGEITTVNERAAELKQEPYQEVAEIDEAMDPDDGNSEGNDTKSRGDELSRDDVLDQETESSEEESENEVEGTNLLSMVQLFNSSDKQEESASNESDESVAGETWESENEQEEINPLEGAPTEPKARRRRDTWKKKITEEQDDIREFNPRAPNFLDVEPDPEAEKVDLRHQMMDERKNAEEYLIDFALRRAVTKLAPDRKKKKVALLVEAFETVMPLPVYEKPLQRAVSEFILTRMQACS